MRVDGRFYKLVRRASGNRSYVSKAQPSSGEGFQLKLKQKRGGEAGVENPRRMQREL